MPKPAAPRQFRTITDPNHEPVRVVDQVTCHHPVGAEINLTLCTWIDSPVDQQEFKPEAVITARLRMKVGMAKLLVDGITKQIAMAEAARSTMN